MMLIAIRTCIRPKTITYIPPIVNVTCLIWTLICPLPILHLFVACSAHLRLGSLSLPCLHLSRRPNQSYFKGERVHHLEIKETGHRVHSKNSGPRSRVQPRWVWVCERRDTPMIMLKCSPQCLHNTCSNYLILWGRRNYLAWIPNICFQGVASPSKCPIYCNRYVELFKSKNPF